MGVKLK